MCPTAQWQLLYIRGYSVQLKRNLLFIIESTTFLKTAEIVFFHMATVIICLVNHKTAFHCISHPNDGLPPVSIAAILT